MGQYLKRDKFINCYNYDILEEVGIILFGKFLINNLNLGNINPTNYFFLENGCIIKNLHELIANLETLDVMLYCKHVDRNKNDFSNWIKDVFGEEKLAEKIYSIKTPKEMAEVIKNCLNDLESEESHLQLPRLIKVENKIGDEIANKLDEILLKEKEMIIREEKIKEIEDKIEKRLDDVSKSKTQNKFFSKDLVQGFIIGVLLMMIGFLVYLKLY